MYRGDELLDLVHHPNLRCSAHQVPAIGPQNSDARELGHRPLNGLVHLAADNLDVIDAVTPLLRHEQCALVQRQRTGLREHVVSVRQRGDRPGADVHGQDLAGGVGHVQARGVRRDPGDPRGARDRQLAGVPQLRALIHLRHARHVHDGPVPRDAGQDGGLGGQLAPGLSEGPIQRVPQRHRGRPRAVAAGDVVVVVAVPDCAGPEERHRGRGGREGHHHQTQAHGHQQPTPLGVVADVGRRHGWSVDEGVLVERVQEVGAGRRLDQVRGRGQPGDAAQLRLGGSDGLDKGTSRGVHLTDHSGAHHHQVALVQHGSLGGCHRGARDKPGDLLGGEIYAEHAVRPARKAVVSSVQLGCLPIDDHVRQGRGPGNRNEIQVLAAEEVALVDGDGALSSNVQHSVVDSNTPGGRDSRGKLAPRLHDRVGARVIPRHIRSVGVATRDVVLVCAEIPERAELPRESGVVDRGGGLVRSGRHCERGAAGGRHGPGRDDGDAARAEGNKDPTQGRVIRQLPRVSRREVVLHFHKILLGTQ
mmetsp:Transcript_5666/g.10386  ORF Transcript_5666/g.10386 Transcript_5666/m.10386 type:complete len:532 (-) Transcript_5666:2866-4461(-)